MKRLSYAKKVLVHTGFWSWKNFKWGLSLYKKFKNHCFNGFLGCFLQLKIKCFTACL